VAAELLHMLPPGRRSAAAAPVLRLLAAGGVGAVTSPALVEALTGEDLVR
jgi:hypothetical protein